MDFERKIRILGKGKTALALKEKFVNANLYDDANFDEYDIESNEITIVSPGIPPHNKMIRESKNLQSDYDLFSDSMPFSIWISGTNGKTTTTQMTQHILESYDSVCGGNIGTPISKLNREKNIWILETSSFTLHYTNKAKPNLYILLPISEDHISWHGSFEEYKKAKLKPLDFMEEGEIAIIPNEFKDYSTKAYKVLYKNSDDLCEKFSIDKSLIKFNEPFLLDAILAMASEKILFDKFNYKKLNTFKVDEHKIEELRDKYKRLWVNDSKATNIDATLNALVSYKDKEIHLILGGDDKGVNLNVLFENLKDYSLKIYAIGSNTDKIVGLCKENNIKVSRCKLLNIAVDEISKKHHDKGVAILSPAAASLDQFTSYSHRGKEFKNLIMNLS